MDGFAGALGIRGESAEDGQARLEFEAEQTHLNPGGTVHGGVLATLVDTAMGMAARTRTDDGEVPATSQLTIAYLTAGRAGPMAVTAQVRKQGEHVLVCDAHVDQDGKTVVHAVATFALL
ncbi:MAG: PaaI family thioesterase [Solirubrobacteraceae bacterium]